MNHATLEHMGAWSFGSSTRYTPKNSDQIPGPGSHDPRLTKSNIGWTQSKNARQSTFIRDGQGVPVGTYSPTRDTVMPSATQYSFNQQPRDRPTKPLTRQTNYNPSQSLTKSKAPNYSFGYVPDPLNNFNTPAPCDYNTHISKSEHNKTQNHFTISDRQGVPRGVPGVGEYQVIPGWKFGGSNRRTYKSASPEQFYNLAGDLKNFNKGKSLGQKARMSSLIRDSCAPPPGTYDPTQIETKKRILSMYEKRTPIVSKQSEQVPGPGTYDLSNLSLSFDDPSRRNLIGFCKSKRPNTVESQTPGPGAYNTHSSLKSTCKSMSKKLKEGPINDGPSPQDYYPKQMQVQTRHSLFMYSDRVDFSKSDTKHLGPGAYNISGSFGSQLGRMGKNKRYTSRNTNPGPGQYQIPTTIGRIPSYHVSLRRKITESGQAKVIKYDPKKTAEIKLVPPQQLRMKKQAR